jgi:hypothetical protein
MVWFCTPLFAPGVRVGWTVGCGAEARVVPDQQALERGLQIRRKVLLQSSRRYHYVERASVDAAGRREFALQYDLLPVDNQATEVLRMHRSCCAHQGQPDPNSQEKLPAHPTHKRLQPICGRPSINLRSDAGSVSISESNMAILSPIRISRASLMKNRRRVALMFHIRSQKLPRL